MTCSTSANCPVVAGTLAFCVSGTCRCPSGYDYEAYGGGRICRKRMCNGDGDCKGHGTCENNDNAEGLTLSKFARVCVCTPSSNMSGFSCNKCEHLWQEDKNMCNICSSACRRDNDGQAPWSISRCDASLSLCGCPAGEVWQTAWYWFKDRMYCYGSGCGNNCNGNGQCVVPVKGESITDDFYPSYCSCDDLHSGARCEACRDSSKDYNYKCTCGSGKLENMSGQCLQALCSQKGDCEPNGRCEIYDNKYQCVCNTGSQASVAGRDCNVCSEGYRKNDSDKKCYLDSCTLNNVECSRSTAIADEQYQAGTCAFYGSLYSCQCNLGYTGPECETCESGFERYQQLYCVVNQCGEGRSCSFHGTCQLVLSERALKCVCEPGYQGEQCNECIGDHRDYANNCACVEGYQELNSTCYEGKCFGESASACSGHGICELSASSTISCKCNLGYEGDVCDSCISGYVKINGACYQDTGCGVAPPECSSKGTCEINGDKAVCTCLASYSGLSCEECKDNANGNKLYDEDCICKPDTILFTDNECHYGTCTQGDHVCSEKGTCIVVSDTLKCECNVGYAGNFCESCADGYQRDAATNECLPYICKQPGSEQVCSGKGVCEINSSRQYACVCNGNYGETYCEGCKNGYELNDDDDQCYEGACKENGITCSGHGQCTLVGSSMQCNCNQDYVGTYCQSCQAGMKMNAQGQCKISSCISPAVSTECSTFGTCTFNAGTDAYSCVCNEHYVGEQCHVCDTGYKKDSQTGQCYPNTCLTPSKGECSGTGTCTLNTNQFVCVCNEGYTGQGCDDCADMYQKYNEQCHSTTLCYNNASKCSGKGDCQYSTTNQHFSCVCQQLYAGDACQLCKNPEHREYENACACASGYDEFSDGKCYSGTCKDNNVVCSNHGSCTVNVDQLECACNTEFTGEFCQTCPDGHFEMNSGCYVDLGCKTDNAVCQGHGECDVATIDGQMKTECICSNGFEGNSCQLCSKNSNGNRDYALGCVCKAGYSEFSDGLCYLGTCKNGDKLCDNHGACQLNDITLTCACSAGYEGSFCENCAANYRRDPVSGSCYPVDCTREGATTECSDHGSCIVEGTSFKCDCRDDYNPADYCFSCPSGYELIGGVCVENACKPSEDAVECTSSANGSCVQSGVKKYCVCTGNYSGQYCETCKLGWKLKDGQCVPSTCKASEAETECSGKAQCTFSSNSYSCPCPPAYAGLECESCANGYKRNTFDNVCYPSSCLASGIITECSGKGTCGFSSETEAFSCACNTGYMSTQCNACAANYRSHEGNCYPSISCETSLGDCSGTGTCTYSQDGLKFVCVCEPKFTGASCGSCLNNSNNNRVFADNCNCKTGYSEFTDSLCYQGSCSGTGSLTCSGHGTCSIISGSHHCQCEHGYEGDECQICVNDYFMINGICYRDTGCGSSGGVCTGKGQCVVDSGVTPNATKCECQNAYMGNSCEFCKNNTNDNRDFANNCACKVGHQEFSDGLCYEGKCKSDDNVTCSNKGICAVESNSMSCQCNLGYSGDLCQNCATGYRRNTSGACIKNNCQPPDDYTVPDCYGRGTCAITGNQFSCTCTGDHMMPYCRLCIAGKDENPTENNFCYYGSCREDLNSEFCNGNGQCTVQTNNNVCSCTGNHSGQYCEECASGYKMSAEGTCVASTCTSSSVMKECSSNGQCTLNGTYACACEAGYTGAECQTCQDGYKKDPNSSKCYVNKCLLQSVECSSRGKCVSSSATKEFTCQCDTGYAGGECQVCDTNFKEHEGKCYSSEWCVNDCSGNGVCTFMPIAQAFECKCNSKFEGTGCNRCKEPANRDDKCNCIQGFQDNDGNCYQGTCYGAEESGEVKCSGRGKCEVINKKESCACDTGYSGTTCESCASGYDRNSAGQCLKSACLYDRNGEFQTQMVKCNGHGECQESSGKFVCMCDTHYAGDSCERCPSDNRDYNELCFCNTGYTEGPDSKCYAGACVNAGESCSSHGDCVIELNSIQKCECKPGYTGKYCQNCASGYKQSGNVCVPSKCRQDGDISDCQSHGTCEQNGSTFECKCSKSYTGDRCEECADGFKKYGDQCLENKCATPNGDCSGRGTCDIDASGDFACTCVNSRITGATCNECASELQLYEKDCQCREGYFLYLDDQCYLGTCGTSDCLNGGACLLGDDRRLNCHCPQEYAGTLCDECAEGYTVTKAGKCVYTVNQCSTPSCNGNGECVEGEDGVFACVCDESLLKSGAISPQMCHAIYKFPAWGSAIIVVCIGCCVAISVSFGVLEYERKKMRERHYRRVNDRRLRSNLKIEVKAINPGILVNKPTAQGMVE